jgi:hypothetical protein
MRQNTPIRKDGYMELPIRETSVWRRVGLTAVLMALTALPTGVAWGASDGARLAELRRMEAPIGHRQPTTKTVPPSGVDSESAIAPHLEIDKLLKICRGC